MYRPRPAGSLVETRSVGGYAASSSVFARLYRNEKRAETIWQPPAQFTPTKAAGMRTTHNTPPRTSKSSSDDTTAPEEAGLLERAAEAVATTLEEDLDAIAQLGLQLLGGGATTLEPPPSVVNTTVDSLSSSSSASSSVDHDARVLEAVGKVLEVLEATNLHSPGFLYDNCSI